VNDILVIEDEHKVALFIKKGLDENGFNTHIAGDGLLGLEKISAHNYDLIILDLNLPLVNGFKICREIRSQGNLTPVLMLTALGSTDNKVNGFESGADDYLVKPFEFRELLARIKALLKRSGIQPSVQPVLKIADLTVDTASRIVSRNGQTIDLTAKEFNLLELLIRNKGKVITRAEIAEKIWEIDFDTGTNVIDVYINFLRKKIDRSFEKKLIYTIIGTGYVIKDPEA
jgi:DNA-binding response OmpR family regulator